MKFKSKNQYTKLVKTKVDSVGKKKRWFFENINKTDKPLPG